MFQLRNWLFGLRWCWWLNAPNSIPMNEHKERITCIQISRIWYAINHNLMKFRLLLNGSTCRDCRDTWCLLHNIYCFASHLRTVSGIEHFSTSHFGRQIACTIFMTRQYLRGVIVREQCSKHIIRKYFLAVSSEVSWKWFQICPRRNWS